MAIYYFRNTGNTDWGTATNWSLTDGGGATGAVPTTADDAYFTANSGNATVTVTNKVCNSLITTGFNGTISCTTALTISGNVTLSATTTIAGTGFFSFSSATSNTYTRNSATINVDNVRVVGTGTYTFADTWNVKTFIFSSAGATLNGSTLNVSTDLTMSQTSGAGTTQINLTGTGTWSGTGALRNNLTINTAGTITVSGTITYNTGTLTYTTGTVTTTGSTLNIGASTTLNTNGISWNNLTITAAATITLTTNLTYSGIFSATAGTITFTGVGTLISSSGSVSLSGTAAVTIPNALSINTLTITSSGTTVLKGDLTCSGLVNLGVNTITTTINNDGSTRTIIATNGFTITGTTSVVGGSALFKVTGGTITGSGNPNTGGYLVGSFEIAGNVTFASTGAFYQYGAGTYTFTYTSGTVTTTGSTLILNASIVTSGTVVWNNVQIVMGSTVPLVLKTDMNVNGLLTLGYTTINNVINNDGVTRTIIAAGGITMSGTTSVVSGTANIRATGGTLTGVSTVQLRNNLEIAGNVTFANGVTFFYNTGTLLYTSGIVTTTGSTLGIATSTTLNTAGIIWNAISWSGGTLTLSSALTATGLITASHANPVINGSDLYANGGFNFTASNIVTTNFSYISGTSTIRFEGSGSWTSPSYGTFRNNVIINPTGNLSINIYYATGTITYSSSNGGTITSAYVTLGYHVSIPSINFSRSATFNTNTMRWNQIYVMDYTNTSNVALTTVTCTSNLNVGLFGFANIGTGTNITIGISLSAGVDIVNLSNFYMGGRITVTLPKDIVADILQFTTGIWQRINGFSITVKRLLTIDSTAGGSSINIDGTTKVIMGDNTIWQRTDNFANPLLFNMEFQGNITIGTTAFPTITYGGSSITYTGSKYSTAKGTLLLSTNATLLNFNKLAFQNLIATSGTTLTMNEFTNGRPDFKSKISPSSTTNYTITFQDTFEKIAKFVTISGATITRRNQLLVITDSKKSSTNSGIRYINNLPNGVPKGDPSVQNTLTPGISTFLVADPAMSIK